MAENPSTPEAGPETQAQARRRCTGTTKAGKPCDAPPRKGKGTCLAHASQEERASAGFGGPEAGALGGRPRKPRVVDIWRAKVEAEADDWFQVPVDARSATHAVVTWDGEKNQITFVPDHRTRLAAFREIMNRVFGKPMQYVDVTARADESQIDHEIADLLGEMDRRDPDLRDVAKANGRA